MKKLIYSFFRSQGKNNHGHITVRHKGGGHKRLFRVINFSYSQIGFSKRLISLEYNPNNKCKILLVKTNYGSFEYILSSNNLQLNQDILLGPNFLNYSGLSKPLWNIPLGESIYNVELKPKKGGQIARSPGSFCTLIALHKSFAVIKLPSKEVRLIKKNCFATLGRVLNPVNYLKKDKKAGQTRWSGIRPTVRGVAMNPIDHPHGGGEGKSPVGHPSSMSPWGKPTHGIKTRKKVNKFFISKKI